VAPGHNLSLALLEGYVVDGALFDEETEVGGCATVRMELRNAQDDELGLVLLVLKDLLSGMLPVGGASSVGRGILHGSATIIWYKGDGSTPISALVAPDKSPVGEAASKIDRAIHAFHEAAIRSEMQVFENTGSSS
jgi:hypothetical protein